MALQENTLHTALNGICPYFTMFPLDFPLNILKNRARQGERVLDPFCGRGTTNFAARLLGLSSIGIDSSPIAVAITAAKLAQITPDKIMSEARKILSKYEPSDVPRGDFWDLAYHPAVLESLCRFRSGFLKDCSTDARIALRGILLGALHGPKQKTLPSYLSNQSPRTFSPKPSYAIRFWRERGLSPGYVDVLKIIEIRANRYYACLPAALGRVRLADSRKPKTFSPESPDDRFDWVITSPPYYGMRTYIPDQWLRNWFLGGKDHVEYCSHGQLKHSLPEFIDDLRGVWQNAARACSGTAKIVIRFGGIRNRKVYPLDLIKASLKDSGWKIRTIRRAGSASEGKRQADAFLRNRSKPMFEYDVWAQKTS